ncbi:outer membrane protein assembly factor BamB [Phycisphaerae bacterium]|jgi:outer membrane protein assembly factor BamB|nr:outer membrane protein assembly factor BamB [Phycisphaerae bacterium]
MPLTYRKTGFGLSLVACACGLATLAGCGGGIRQNNRPQGKLPQVVTFDSQAISGENWKTAGYRLDWVGFPFPSTQGVNMVRDVIAADDVIVAQDRQSRLAVLEANNGQVRWSTSIANPLTKFVGLTRDAADASRLIVSSESEAFVLGLNNGSLLARESFERVVNTAPVAMPGQLIYGTGVGEVLAHRLGTGLKAWGFQGNGTIEADPVKVGDLVGVVSQRGDVMFFSPDGGSLVGRGMTFGGLGSNPVASSDTLYVASRDQSVWAFASNGTTRWRYRTPSVLTSQPMLHANALYVNVPGDGLTSLNSRTGEVNWKSKDIAGDAIAARGKNVLVFDGTALTVVDAARGRVVMQFATPGIVRFISDKKVDGNLYAITQSNQVVKYIPQ